MYHSAGVIGISCAGSVLTTSKFKGGRGSESQKATPLQKTQVHPCTGRYLSLLTLPWERTTVAKRYPSSPKKKVPFCHPYISAVI